MPPIMRRSAISAKGALRLFGLTQSGSRSFFCPWPFAKWGIDIIGSLPTAHKKLKFIVVAVDYLTKWAEAILLSTITEKNLTKFIRENIIYRFGIPQSLVLDNAFSSIIRQ